MMRLRRLAVLALVCVSGCDVPVLESGSGSQLSLRIVAPAHASTAALDGARLHIEGPTSRTLNVAPGSTQTITDLQPGTYTVALEGLVGGEVESYGEASGVVVTAGRNTPVTVDLVPFAATLSVPEVVSFGPTTSVVINPPPWASSFRIEWSPDPTFTNAVQSTQASNSNASFATPLIGQNFIRVRAINRFGTIGRPGRSSVIYNVPAFSQELRSIWTLVFNGAGNGASMVTMQAVFTDEYLNSDATTLMNQLDRRNVSATDNQLYVIYANLQHARQRARLLATIYQNAQQPQNLIAGARLMEGFADLWLAETFCSGVPGGDIVNGLNSIGQPRTTAQIFSDAVTAFDIARTADPNLREALVGRARARINLGQYQAALADAAQVPTNLAGFVDPGDNGIWSLTNSSTISVANLEGTNGVPFRAIQDPRVPWQDAARLGPDGITPVYLQRVFPTSDAPVSFATGLEAQLILAEARLATNDIAGFLATHNALRAARALPALADPGTPNARLDLHFRERALWLYSRGHRLGDLRRLIRLYGRGANSVFPTGNYHKGGSYGGDVNLPIPSAHGTCIDRSA